MTTARQLRFRGDAREKVLRGATTLTDAVRGTLGPKATVEVVEGMHFDRGYLSPYFVTNPDKMEAVLEDPAVLLHEKRITTMQDFIPLLEQVAKAGRSLLVMALFQKLNDEGITVILVTHEHDIAQYAKRVIEMRDGRIIRDEPVTDRHDAAADGRALRLTMEPVV